MLLEPRNGLWASMMSCLLLAGCAKPDGSAPKPGYGAAKAQTKDESPQPPPTAWDPQADFRQRDKNRDGHIDLAEFLGGIPPEARQMQTDIFRLIDRDGDGKITLEEFKNQPPTVQFRQMDQNGDGSVDLREFCLGEANNMAIAHARRLLKACDRNNDGKLSYVEWIGRPGEAWFVKMDVDQDGRVSQEELGKGDSFLLTGNRLAPAFAACDRNGDGYLTPDEFPDKPVEAIFVYMDLYGDGKLDIDEYVRGASTPEEVPAAKSRFKKKDRDRDGFLTLREYLYHLADAPFWDMDKDGDGYVSREEYLQTPGQGGSGAKSDAPAKFAAMDLNHDGKLTLTEFKNAAAKQAQPASKDPDNLPPLEKFALADQNKDGMLDFKEFCLGEGRGLPADRAQKLVTLIDANKDGKISIQELCSCPGEAWFMRIDRDADGRISRGELARFDSFLLAGNRVDRAFAGCDLNGDGFLSFEEFAHRPPEVAFIYADNDGDGDLSPAEFLAGRTDPKEVAAAKALFTKKDRDQDGFLSFREYLDDPADAAFWEMDQDGDAYVSREEYLRAAARGAAGTRPAAVPGGANAKPPAGEAAKAKTPGKPPAPPPPPDPKLQSPEARFNAIDLNHDGKLSLTEFRIATGKR